jgi:hypothetical protein
MLGNTVIERIDKFQYLGSIITEDDGTLEDGFAKTNAVIFALCQLTFFNCSGKPSSVFSTLSLCFVRF